MEETTNANPTPNAGGTNWKVVGGIIAAIIVIGVIAFGMGGGIKNGDEANNASSLKALIAMSGSQKCEVSSPNDGQESNGEIYVANGMMRGNFTSDVSGKIVASHMIVKNNTSYIWTDDMPQGFMMAINETPAGTDGETPDQQAIDLNQEYSYKCANWSTDESVFELPSNINFSDISAMMKGLAPTNPESGNGSQGEETLKAQQCSACNAIPDATAKAQCLASLGCN